MVKFLKENVLTHPSDAGVFVLDVDLQGQWLGPDHTRFKMAFPKVYETYLKTCIFDYHAREGTVMLCEEGGYKIALLFTKRYRKIVDEDKLRKNFESCLKQLFTLIPSDVYFYSPVLGRRDKVFNNYMVALNRILYNNGEAPRQWFVCKDK